MQTHSLGNILREIRIDLSIGDFTDESGFFVRAGIDGIIKYCPMNNKSDAEAITKIVTATPYFIDPVLCRKVFSLVTSPDTELYAGYGV